jgi:hypothetical protein
VSHLVKDSPQSGIVEDTTISGGCVKRETVLGICRHSSLRHGFRDEARLGGLPTTLLKSHRRYRSSLLKSAIALVPTHGFTRQALASAAASLPEPHAAPLSEAGMNALFGTGDDARRTLIKAWLEDAEHTMVAPGETGASAVKVALGKRLRANEPVLHLLPEVRFLHDAQVLRLRRMSKTFAFLAAPQTRIGRWTFPAAPVLDPRPGFEHAFNVAHRACLAAGDKPDGVSTLIIFNTSILTFA